MQDASPERASGRINAKETLPARQQGAGAFQRVGVKKACQCLMVAVNIVLIAELE